MKLTVRQFCRALRIPIREEFGCPNVKKEEAAIITAKDNRSGAVTEAVAEIRAKRNAPPKPPTPPPDAATIGTGSIWGVAPYMTFNYDSVATTGGRAYGLRLFWGDAFSDRANLWGLAASFETASLQSHLPELNGKTDSRYGVSLFVDRWDISRTDAIDSNKPKPNWNFYSKDLRGLGISQFCPAVGDTCWGALHVDSVTSLAGLRYKDMSTGSKGFYGALSFNISTKTYLHLTSDDNLRNYSHPAREFGFNLAVDLGYGDPSIGAAANETLTGTEMAHEIFKYLLEDLSLYFSAKTAGTPLQKASELLDDAGFGNNTPPGPNAQPSATTTVSTLLFLNAVSGGLEKSKHLKLFDKMSSESRDLFFWGNVGNSALLMVSALAADSNTTLQGALSSAQHTANLVPAWRGATPETTYWVRFAIPHLMAMAGLAASDSGKRRSFLLSATEGMMTASDVPVESTGYSLSLYQNTTQTFDKGSLRGQRGEVGVEKKLKSGFSTRTAIASPNIAIGNGNVVAFGENVATDVGVVKGSGSAYAAPTLPTTVSSMVGWRGRLGDTVHVTASVFVGTAVDLGPQATPRLGVTGRASVGAGFEAFTLFKKGVSIGAEVFVSGAKFSDNTTTDHGVAAMITVR